MNEANETTFRDWERALKSGGFGTKILSRHRYALTLLEGHADGADLLELDQAAIQDWIIGLDRYATSTRLTYFSSARAFYNFAVTENMIGASPMARMKAPKDPYMPVPIPPEDDIRALIVCCEADRTPAGIRDAAMIRIMADTGGPRASEVAGILLRNDTPVAGLDLRNDEITIQGKNGKVRTWPIANNTARASSRWLRARAKLPSAARQPYVFLSLRGGFRITRECPAEMLERRCAEAGIPRLHPHQIRHFSVDQFYKAGGREGDAKRLYGWDSDAMPRRYAAAHAARRATDAGRQLAIGDRW